MQYESTFNAIDNILRNEAGCFKELDMDKLPTLIDMKYHSVSDARQLLGMDAMQIRNFFLDFQHELYNGPAVNAATA